MLIIIDGQQDFQHGSVKFKRLNVASLWECQRAMSLVTNKKTKTESVSNAVPVPDGDIGVKRAQHLQETGATERTWICY